MAGDRSVVVLRDWTETFEAGAEFTVMDLAFGVLNETWPMGIKFQLNGYTARMIGKVLVRSDRKMMHVDSGGTYRWEDF